MSFQLNLDKIKAAGLEYAEKGMGLANDLADRAKREGQILNAQNKLAKAQRELGALVYSLAKNGEQNQPLLDKYIDAISELEQEIEQLRAVPAEAEIEVEPLYAEDVEGMDLEESSVITDAAPSASEEDQPKETTAPEAAPMPRFCSACGAPVTEDALFCNRCGKQL